MSSHGDFQELGFPDDRQKLDGFRLFNPGSPQDTKNATADTEFNIRRSLAWDSAFFTNPGVLEPEELFQTLNSRTTGNAIYLLGHEEEILLATESLELERTRKIDKYNIRKSLAWDNAFFTSAGVLDSEELSIVNRGFKKCETHQLPGIAEVLRSADSICTIDSGCSSLTSLEFELFEDNRSSVLKPASLSSVTTSSLKLKRGRNVQNFHASKKPDASSRMRMKSIPTSQRQSLNVPRPEKILKEVSVSSQKQLAAGNGKLNSQASVKPPKISSRVNQSSTAAAKRACLGGNYVKMGPAQAAPGQSMAVSKKPCLGISCSVSNGFTPSPKSSSSGSPTPTHEPGVYCSPYKGICNTSGDAAGKSPLNSRRKADSSLVNSASNGFTMETPLWSTKTNKDEPESSCHPCSLLFTPKSSTYTSPASSLDGSSSVSSSTSVNQSSKNPEASLHTISRQVSFESDISQASDLENHLHHQPCIGHGNQEARLPNKRNEKMSMGNHSVSNHIKPSGLRVPSPKIGFFDEETCLARSSGSMQFHAGGQSMVSRSGSGNGNLNGAANRYGKLQPPRTLDGTGYTRPSLQKTGSPCRTLGISPWRTAHIEAQNASVNEPDMKGSEVHYDLLDKVNSKNCLRTAEVDGKKHDAAERVTGNSSREESKVSSKNVRTVLKRSKIQPDRENEELKMHCPRKNLCSLQNDDKENAYFFKDEIDGLTKHVGAIDLGCNVVKEMKADKNACHA